MNDKSNVLIDKYEEILATDPRSRVFAPLSEMYRRLGMHDRAMETLKSGLRFNPEYVLGFLSLAQCYQDLGQFSLSYSTLRPLVASNRDNLRMQRLFAEACEVLGNKEEALDTYKFLLFINPRDSLAASKVEKLEEFERQQREENVTQKSLFTVDQLNDRPKAEDHDDWVQVELGVTLPLAQEKEQPEPKSDVEDEWIFKSSGPTAKDLAQEVTPVITHTLVDLYIAQGHQLKALEILEKILELNPGDHRTRERIIDLKKTSDLDEPAPVVAMDQAIKPGDGDSLMSFFDSKVGAREVADHPEIAIKRLRDFQDRLRDRSEAHRSK
jgi:tetratricopeptide (TPR) repeat protein